MALFHKPSIAELNRYRLCDELRETARQKKNNFVRNIFHFQFLETENNCF